MHIKRNGTMVVRTAFFWVTKQQLVLKVIDNIFKMEPIFPETSLRNAHYSLRNNTEECSSHPFRQKPEITYIPSFSALVYCCRTWSLRRRKCKNISCWCSRKWCWEMYRKMGRFMISTVHPILCCGEITKKVMKQMELTGKKRNT